MPDPAVSVVMPTFGDHPWIAEAVGSILSQDFTDLELIIVPVLSDRATREALATIADPRIRIVGSTIASITRQMNRGTYRARGKWLMQFASDDVMLPGALGKLVECAEAHDAVVVYPDYVVTNVHLKFSSRYQSRSHDHDALMGRCYVTDVSLVRREEFMKHMPMRYSDRRHRIYRVWRELSAAHPGRFVHYSEPTFYYRQTGDNEHIRRNTPEVMTDMVEEPLDSILRDET